jgi:hypothetical protein
MSRTSPTPRPISEQEAAVIERALTIAAVRPEALDLATTVRSLHVVDTCGCGCASVDFLVPPAGVTPHIVADAAATAPDGEDLGLFVWAIDGALVGLEIYSYSDRPAPLPDLASVQANPSASGAA